jgi:hypothetical protein
MAYYLKMNTAKVANLFRGEVLFSVNDIGYPVNGTCIIK